MLWWRIDFDADTQDRVRSHVQGIYDMSSDRLEFLAMVVTAWAFTAAVKAAPQYVGDSILVRGDNMSVVHWVNRCREGRELMAGELMGILGCVDMRSGWCFRAKHVRGIVNVLPDRVSRWDRPTIAPNLTRSVLTSMGRGRAWGRRGRLSVLTSWPPVRRWLTCELD